jgi:hypothetical protein
VTITEFLLARIAEDEADARDRSMSAPIHYPGCYYYNYSLDANRFCDCDEDGDSTKRVLAECAAKRAIIEQHRESRFFARHQGCVVCRTGSGPLLPVEYPCPTVRALAAVYKDHPDYQPEWAL